MRGLSGLVILGRFQLERTRVRTLAAARGIRASRFGRLPWRRGAFCALVGTAIIAATLTVVGVYYIYFDRANLPDLEAFSRFKLPTVGHVYDSNDRALAEMATEYRQITTYPNIPPIVRDAILAAEDRNFFSHNGVEYIAFARVVYKLRIRDLITRLTKMGRRDSVDIAAIFPQGGSTITQQLVRGYFLASSGEFVGDLRVQRRVLPRNRWNFRQVESKDRCCCSELTP